MRKPNFFRLLGIAAMATGLACFDNSIKGKIEDGTIDNGVIEHTKGFAEIEKHHNKGLPLNKLDEHTKEITFVSVIVMFFQAVNTLKDALNDEDSVKDAANALIMAGALSNTYDRVERGYVVDYLKIGRKRAIYNLSDFFIIFGVIIRFIKALID
ncbi:MAG: signal peptidase II [Lachnospiraceae bacterium]|nr:signal peptidase II [Lachnospiraceae bacterium]